MTMFRRAGVLVAVSILAVAAMGCVPPPEEAAPRTTTPTTTPPAPECWRYDGGAGQTLPDYVYLGPANTVGNARWYESYDGTCSGTAHLANLAFGATGPAAREACRVMVPASVGAPTRLNDYYRAAPTDLWLC